MIDNSVWHDRLLSIPVVAKAGLLGWQALQPGSNQNFKIETTQGHWVVRFNQSIPGVDRLVEQQLLQQLQHLAWLPTMIDCDPGAGYLITEFIEQSVWQKSDFSNPQRITQLADQLRLIHLQPCDQAPTRLDRRIQYYLSQTQVAADLQRRLTQGIDTLEQLQFWTACRWLCHHDLNPGNLLGHKPVYLIDWEFAGQGHAILDWLIMEQESGADLSSWYPEDTRPDWIIPLKTLISDLMKLWNSLTTARIQNC
ncbi:phosphotransferase [Marinicella sediminis]|uniref:Phosphotransferase n=1 Tax=Marinicella sediminis TaxID=1792834 RepID=A0ABV7J4F3_9GAMM|nr:phosphotransferase [Marinicella sediminis]